MNMKKQKANKIITTMLTFVMLIAMIPANVFAADPASNTITIEATGSDSQAKTAVAESLQVAIASSGVVATAVTSLKVTAGEVTEADWKYLKSLTAMTTFEIADDEAVTKVANIPNGENNVSIFPNNIVTVIVPQAIKIGNHAFRERSKLETVTFPNATSIGERAFYECTALKTADFPEATTIDDNAFGSCQALESAIFPKVTSIGDNAFQSCNALTTVNLPKATTISESAFRTCYALTTISLPNATDFGKEAFIYCEMLTTLKLGANVPTVGERAFLDCPADRSLVIVDADGKTLTGTALTTAQNAYKAANDGNTGDNLWYGWKVTAGANDPTPPTDPTKPQAKTINIYTNQAKEQTGTLSINDFFKSVPAGAVIDSIKSLTATGAVAKSVNPTVATSTVFAVEPTIKDGKIVYTAKANITETGLEEKYEVTFAVNAKSAETLKATLTFKTVKKSTSSGGGSSYSGGGTSTYTNHTPEIISGAKQTIIEKNNEQPTFRIDRPFRNFLYVEAGKTVLVEGTHYTVKEGSTIVTLLPAYTNTLSVGTHTVRVEFIDGYAVLEFEVKPKATTVAPTAPTVTPPASYNPQTGDSWFAGLFF